MILNAKCQADMIEAKIAPKLTSGEIIVGTFLRKRLRHPKIGA